MGQRQTVGLQLLESALKIALPGIGIAGTLASVLALKYGQKDSISLFQFVIALSIAAFLIATLLHALLKISSRSTHSGPSVKKVYAPHIPYTECQAVLLLEPNDIFIIGASITFKKLMDGYERGIGFGEVAEVQQNGMIVATLIDVFQDDVAQDIVKNLLANNKDTIESLLVRPHVVAAIARQAQKSDKSSARLESSNRLTKNQLAPGSSS